MATCTRQIGLLAAIALLSGMTAAGYADEIVSYEIVDESSIPAYLTGAAGDPDKGREAFINRKQGNCLGCHVVAELDGQPFHGEVGPSLDGVADRYEEGEIRLRLVNAKMVNPDTIMPGFYVTEGLNRVASDFAGKPILTADQIEDIVAYLMTLSEG